MERWLHLINNRLCKYQHDKIYSILGIMSEPVVKLVLDADYCQPAQNVFKKAVRAFVYGTGLAFSASLTTPTHKRTYHLGHLTGVDKAGYILYTT